MAQAQEGDHHGEHHLCNPFLPCHEHAAAEVECRGPLTRSSVRQPSIRAFMDDLTVTMTSVPGSRWILKGLEELITWARMIFKLSVQIPGAKDRQNLTQGSAQISLITHKPVKSIWKVFRLHPERHNIHPSHQPTSGNLASRSQ